jgi:type IV fimbrial biogenesis protein FimT
MSKVVYMYRKRGFTLIEFVMAIATLALLVAIGVPSYQELAKNNTISTTSNELLAGLLLARSEAVRQEAKHEFNPHTYGWLVKTDNATLLDHTVTSDHIKISGAPVTYGSRGRANLDTKRSIDISYKDILVSRICLSLSGRPFIKKDGECP